MSNSTDGACDNAVVIGNGFDSEGRYIEVDWTPRKPSGPNIPVGVNPTAELDRFQEAFKTAVGASILIIESDKTDDTIGSAWPGINTGISRVLIRSRNTDLFPLMLQALYKKFPLMNEDLIRTHIENVCAVAETIGDLVDVRDIAAFPTPPEDADELNAWTQRLKTFADDFFLAYNDMGRMFQDQLPDENDPEPWVTPITATITIRTQLL